MHRLCNASHYYYTVPYAPKATTSILIQRLTVSDDVLVLRARKSQPGARHHGKEQMERNPCTPEKMQEAVGTAVELTQDTPN